MDLDTGVIILLLFISWYNTNDYWPFGFTMITFALCLCLLVFSGTQDEEKKNKPYLIKRRTLYDYFGFYCFVYCDSCFST